MNNNKYIVIKSHDMSIFVDRVNRKIEEGYTVTGGLLFASGEFIQAMVKV